MGNNGRERGGGVGATSWSNIDLRGVVIGANMAQVGGGLYLQGSTLVAAVSAIDGNRAERGAGIFAVTLSTIDLRDGTSCSGNTASLSFGGCVSLQESTLVASSATIQNNMANTYGGGLHAFRASTITIADGTEVSHNMARDGGGLYLTEQCSLDFTGRVSLHGNAAGLVGGGIAADRSSSLRFSGNTILSHNTATADGGAIALLKSSTLTDSGDAALGCLLTVLYNSAKGNGGGLYVSGDSSVSLSVSTAVISHNVAAKQGGGLFVDIRAAESDECIVAKVMLWRLDLVNNTAPTGDGGGALESVFASMLS